MKRCNKGTKHLTTVGACLGVVVGGTALLHGQTSDSTVVGTNKLEKLEKENQDLRKRLDVLEAMAEKEGLLPAEPKATHPWLR